MMNDYAVSFRSSETLWLNERLPAFGARTFSPVITTSMVQDVNEKIAGVACMMR
jgi:hypothetical protein